MLRSHIWIVFRGRAPNRQYSSFGPTSVSCALCNSVYGLRERVISRSSIYPRIFPSFNWGIFAHVTRLDQSRASENISWIINIYIHICIYIWEKKTNKLQVHPYKPVSWSPTHQGIFICIYISGDFHLYIYIYIYISALQN